MQSLAAYSLVLYLLGLEHRHNGNIMIDTRGHFLKIDFGFAMGMKPLVRGNQDVQEQLS
jgi:phosphatidylinositol kinase/protein kinase (PI-3  family)